MNLKAVAEIDGYLRSRSKHLLEENIIAASKLADAIEYIRGGKAIVEAPWCGKESCRLRAEGQTEAEIIGFPVDGRVSGMKCLVCDDKAKESIYLARTH